ncbi:MAG: hypothetical protein ACTSYA_09805 [Candidatus Kariarchaeaceae archaeon]
MSEEVVSSERQSAYARVLSYSDKPQLLFTINMGIFIVLLVFRSIMAYLFLTKSSDSYQSGNSGPIALFFIFLLVIFFYLIMIITYLDMAVYLEMLVNKKTFFGAFMIFTGIFSLIVVTFLAENLFPRDEANLISILLFIDVFLGVGFTSYFLALDRPKEFGKDTWVQKMTNVRERLKNKRLLAFPMQQSIDRGLRWIYYAQSKNGIWGNKNPLFETSRVLIMFKRLEKQVDHTWASIEGPNAPMRSLEEAVFTLKESLRILEPQPTFERLYGTVAVGQYDQTEIDNMVLTIEDWKTNTFDNMSEWDLIREMEDYNPLNILETTPKLFPQTMISYLSKSRATIRVLADILNSAAGVLVRRSQSSFSFGTESDLHPLMVSLLTNTLSDMNVSFSNLDGIKTILKNSQNLEGGWSMVTGGIDDKSYHDVFTTAECLKSIIYQETHDTLEMKLGTNYLLAMQNSDGSWGKSIIDTCSAIEALFRVKQRTTLAPI